MKELIAHFRNYIHIKPEEEEEIAQYFQLENYKKKAELLEAGKRCQKHYFVVKGCLRLYFLDEKGVEQTTQFAIENWWITDYLNFEQQGISSFSIQTVEATTILSISTQQQAKLLQAYPELERYFRLIYQKAYGASQLRFKYFYDFSRETFYLHFTEHFPEFTQRIPQQLLASYLNMTPEYLSEIKRKLLSQPDTTS